MTATTRGKTAENPSTAPDTEGDSTPEAPKDPAALAPSASATIVSEFEALGLAGLLLRTLSELRYVTPTPIQAQSIPLLIAGKDVVGQSQTGSGKTAAYALPLLNRLDISQSHVAALVVCPTRELSAQVARELRKFGRHLPGLSVALLVGGHPPREQTLALERGAHIVVGTPGRLNDLVTRGRLNLAHTTYVVLDEADRMLDMGFEQEVTALLAHVPRTRQTAFFSATFPTSVGELSAKHQRAPLRIDVTSGDAPAPSNEELAVRLAPDQKLVALLWALGRYTPRSALVFANQKFQVAEATEALNQAGVSVASLHGDLEQYDRDLVMAKFRNGSIRVLVATDIAARGIDLDKLELVVNLELPNEPEVYVHRIGRTGRAGNVGRAISFYSTAEQAKLDAITLYLGRSIPKLEYRDQPDHGRVPAAAAREASMDTLRVSGGRKDKLRPSDILGALTGEAGGLLGTDVGTIEIHDHFTYVAISRSVSARALRSLGDGRIKGKRFRVTLQ